MTSRVDPAAIAEEARTVRLDAVFRPPRRSVPVGDSSPESRTLTPLIMVRIQVPQATKMGELHSNLAKAAFRPAAQVITAMQGTK
jgi:hypothetical protein